MITVYISQALCKSEANNIELVNLMLPAPGNMLRPPIYD